MLLQGNSRLVGITAVEQGDSADALYELRGGFRAKLLDQTVPRFPITDPDAHLEQFMTRKSEIQFIAYRRCITGIANHDHGFELMS